MKNLTVARRYAKALLLIGESDGKAENYGTELAGFAKLLADEKDLDRAITNPLYESSNRKNVLTQVVEKLSLSPIVRSFLLLLFDKRRIGFVSDISGFYAKFYDDMKNIVHASVVSAVELSDDTIGKIKTTLSEKTGKDIKVEVSQDPGLIGGIVTRMGDLVIDGSIKTQLYNMTESLKRSESI